MKIVVAPDKFKGSLSASEAAAAMAVGLGEAFPSATIVKIPIADGGEGTMALISELIGATVIEVCVTGPNGSPVDAKYAIAGKRAVIEMSAASGFMLVPESARDPWVASTFGTGELIADALQRGVDEIIIGIGGSATNDGGKGMAEALGYQFDEQFRMTKAPEQLPAIKITVACDVDNPLLGPLGCTRVFGPQKGIQERDFERHETRLANLSASVPAVSPETPGAGAAGGLGFGLMAFCGAQLCSGFELVAQLSGLQSEIAAADLVITGEGRMDAQTLMGKGPAGVADMARSAGVRIIGLCGSAEGESALLERFDQIITLEGSASDQQDSIARAAELLESVCRGLS